MCKNRGPGGRFGAPGRISVAEGRAMVNHEQLQLQIAAQALTIAWIQKELRYRSLSPSMRQELENEMLDRIHLRFVALHALKLMTTGPERTQSATDR
jgi:hypothetical protein